MFPPRIEVRCGDARLIDLAFAVELRKTSSGKTLLRAVHVPPKGRVVALLQLTLPKLEREAQFDIIQLKGKRIVGGNTYLLKRAATDS